MNKNIKTIAFFLVIAIQLACILCFVAVKQGSENKLEEMGTEIKIKLDYVTLENFDYQGNYVLAANTYLSNILYNSNGYIVFEEAEDGFYDFILTEEKPNTSLYIKTRNPEIENLLEKYRTNEISKLDLEDIYIENLYDKGVEENNIKNGKCQGPETVAYATYLLHENSIMLKDIYINDIHIDDYVEGYMNGEIEISRYEQHFDWDSDIDWGEVAEDILNGEDVSV